MANFLSVNWEEAPSFFDPLKGPYSLSLWLITLCQFLFCNAQELFNLNIVYARDTVWVEMLYILTFNIYILYKK